MRSAADGSIRAALRAGRYAARSAGRLSKTATAVKVSGSAGRTPYSILDAKKKAAGWPFFRARFTWMSRGAIWATGYGARRVTCRFATVPWLPLTASVYVVVCFGAT